MVQSILTNDDIVKSTFSDKPLTRPLSLLHLNIRSLPAHITELETYLSMLKYDFNVIGISETWLKESTYEIYNLQNYNHIAKFRDGGGVSLLIDKCLTFIARDDLSIFDNILESNFVEILNESSNENVIIGLIYRPPGPSLDVFHRSLENIFHVIKQENKTCYLMG